MHVHMCVYMCLCYMCTVVLHNMMINIEYHDIFIARYCIMSMTILLSVPYMEELI